MKVRELVPRYSKIEAGDPRPNARGQVWILSSKNTATLMRPIIGDDAIDEHTWCIYLNGGNRLLAVYRISEGGLTSALASVPKVFRGAVLVNAAAFVFIHNHPSGETTPSGADHRVTEDLVRAGELMGIPCLDHVILGEAETYFSFSDRGLITEYRSKKKPQAA